MFALTTTQAPLNSKCFQMELEEGSQLWHNRFGHLSYSGLKTLSSKQMVNVLKMVVVPSRHVFDKVICVYIFFKNVLGIV